MNEETLQQLSELIGSSGVRMSADPREGGWWGLSLQVLEEWAFELRGSRAAKVYREIKDNESLVGSALLLMLFFASRAVWRVEPASDQPHAQEAARFVQSCMDDLGTPGKLTRQSWRDVLVAALSCTQFGFSIFEVAFKPRRAGLSDFQDGKWGWKKLLPIGQESIQGWLFDTEGDLEGVQQLFNGKIVDIRNARRLVLIRVPGAHNPENPEGRSMLRSCVVPYTYKKGLQKIQSQGAQRNLVGLPRFEVPLEYLDARVDEGRKKLITRITALGESLDADRLKYALLPAETDAQGKPTGFKMSLMTGNAAKAIDLEPTIQRYGREIAVGLFAEWLLLGSTSAGSFALADSKTSMWAGALEGLLDLVCETFNRQLLPPLLDLNGIPRAHWPRLAHGGITQEDRMKLASAVSELLKAGGLTHDDALEAATRARLGLPPKGATPEKEV